jgi:ATP-independent RNA helicase DbpA
MNPNSFSNLPLPPATLVTLERLGYVAMTPIQAAALPLALAGKDLIAQAATGSGKTAAFALALLQRIETSRFDVQALVLCPTRELADQVTQEIRRLARAEDNIKILTLCGGSPIRPQLDSLAHGAHIVVGTPGRLMDHLERDSLNLAQLSTLVLDEADRMLDMGFIDDIRTVVKRCPKNRLTLLFSATYPDDIAALAQQFMRTPQRIELNAQHSASTIEQHWFEVNEADRLHAVTLLLWHHRPSRTLAFCNTRQQCRDLVEVLKAHDIEALALHGELEQRERDQVLLQFANHSISVLVATDVAARGLDVADMDAVINVDVCHEPEVHVHRIGRTGRAGAQGLALNLVSMEEMGRVGRIELLQGRETVFEALPAEPDGRPEPLRPPMITLQILGGRKDKIRPGDILGALTGDVGLDAKLVGKIHVGDYTAHVAIARTHADEALKRLDAGKLKGRKVKVRYLHDVV